MSSTKIDPVKGVNFTPGNVAVPPMYAPTPSYGVLGSAAAPQPLTDTAAPLNSSQLKLAGPLSTEAS